MNKDLKNKYLEGQSSLEEEKILFKQRNVEHLDVWADYLQHKKVATPSKLNEHIWTAIDKDKKQKQRFFITIGSLAASLLIAIAFILNHEQNKLEAKEALLKEAISLFPQQATNSQKNIIYEDEIIMIYRDPASSK